MPTIIGQNCGSRCPLDEKPQYKSKLIIADGAVNHVLLLVSLGKTVDISELVGDIKWRRFELDKKARQAIQRFLGSVSQFMIVKHYLIFSFCRHLFERNPL